MGIARFYRWLSERYPLINEVIDVDSVPEFDNFYLDMNGIIHHCSHGNTGGRKQASEDHMWLDVFKYISGLVYRIKPKKLLYLAVDGVAPRAKMNQQRSRRFRSAHDAKESRSRNSQMNGQGPHTNESEPPFDSNCITPGTEFMERLVYHLEFFVQKKIAEDPLWRDLKIVLSGPDVPGEGEHKIMDYIRSVKSQPGYDPNTRHCLYGLDADLVMLSLVSHEPYFALLREEIDFSFTRTKSKENRSMIKPDKFQLLHIGILREYLALEFLGDKYVKQEAGALDLLDRVIDDFILFCFLVGNDFLPHLPFSEIGEGGLNKLFACYKDLMGIREGVGSHFLVRPDGSIDYANLFIFLERYMVVEYELVDTMLSNESWKIGQTRICNSETPAIPAPDSEMYKDRDLDDDARDPQELWENVKKVDKRSLRGSRRVSQGIPPSVEAAMEEYYDIKLGIEAQSDKDKLVLSYLEGLQWVYWYYYKGPPSWDWYYPYHYSPFAVDVVDVLERLHRKGESLNVRFQEGKPFLPFQQLMAVLPPASGKNLLPPALYDLMVNARSPIRDFYPEEFQIDIDGVRVPWGGVTIIPFVDEKLLVSTIDAVISRQGTMTEKERRRNSQGTAKLFSKTSLAKIEDPKSGSVIATSAVSTIPTLVKDVSKCKILIEPFRHEPLPAGMELFPHYVLKDYSPSAHPDFPSLFKYTDKFIVNFSFGSGVRIFNTTSKQESLFINLTIRPSRIAELEKISAWTGEEKIAFNFPFYSKEFRLVSITDGTVKLRFSKNRTSTENCERNKHEGDVDWIVARLEESGLTIDIEEGEAQTGLALFYSQPVIELSADTQRPETIKALGSIAFVVERKKRPSELVALSEAVKEHEATSDSSQISLNVNNQQIFGQSFVVENNTAVFADVRSVDSLLALNSGIGEILKISQSVKYTQWLGVKDVALTVGCSEDFVWSLFGEVWIRFGKFQEEVGMNLWSFASTGEPQCVPGYSKFVPNQTRRSDNRGQYRWNRWDQPDRREWRFSSEAVKALRDYMRDQPELTGEIQASVQGVSHSVINGGLTVQGKRLFARFSRPKSIAKPTSNRDDWVSEYFLNKIVGYVNSARWKNVSICPWNYEFLGSSFVHLVANFIDSLSPELKNETVKVSETTTFALSESTLASSLKNTPPISLGQRGIYVKTNGMVPIRTTGTVIGFYGSELVDVLLDTESMNASSLNGLCPDMRGIRIKRSDWRAAKPLLGTGKDHSVTDRKNKILAQLVIEHEKNWNASHSDAKPVVTGAIQPIVSGAIAPMPVGGLKLNVNDLFAAAAKQPSSYTAPRRPLPPTALVQLPPELSSSSQPKKAAPGEIPNFLLEKLRPAK
jgi:5'-3' exonuclease